MSPGKKKLSNSLQASSNTPLPPYVPSAKHKALWPNWSYEQPPFDLKSFKCDLRAWNKAWEDELTVTYR